MSLTEHDAAAQLARWWAGDTAYPGGAQFVERDDDAPAIAGPAPGFVIYAAPLPDRRSRLMDAAASVVPNAGLVGSPGRGAELNFMMDITARAKSDDAASAIVRDFYDRMFGSTTVPNGLHPTNHEGSAWGVIGVRFPLAAVQVDCWRFWNVEKVSEPQRDAEGVLGRARPDGLAQVSSTVKVSVVEHTEPLIASAPV